MSEPVKKIPKYMKNVPWYGPGGPGAGASTNEGELSHHFSENGPTDFSVAVPGGRIEDKFKKVNEVKIRSKSKAKNKVLLFKNRDKIKCTNCGSMSHDTVDCLEKVHKAPYTKRKGKEAVKQVLLKDESAMDYERKRDAYYGFDASELQQNLEQSHKSRLAQEEKVQDDKQESAEEIDDERVELAELGLLGDERIMEMFKRDRKKAPGEKAVRSFEDRPSYIENISLDDKERPVVYNERTKTVTDEKFGNFNEDTMFVKEQEHGEIAWERASTK